MSTDFQKQYDERGEGVLNKSIRAGKWLAIDFVVRKILQFAPFFILARLLTPADFGAIAIIMLIPRFLQATTETGLATAAIQRGGDPTKYLNAIWTVNILRGIGIALLVFFSGPFIASFYHAQSVALPIRLGGIFIIIYQLSNIGEIWFTKELDFKKIFIRNAAKTIVYGIVSIGVALIYPNYWALVFGNLALHLTETISSYILHPYRPKLTWNFRPLKELTAYSKWIMGQILIDQTYAFTEQSVVARLTNTGSLGLYSKAKNLASIGPGTIGSILGMISLPAFAKIKDSREKIADGFKKSMDLLFVVIMPITVLMIIGGGKIVELLLGSPWVPMTRALQIFLVYYGLATFAEIAYKLLSGVGFPDKKVRLDVIKIILSLVLLFFLTPLYGIEGAAVALTIGSFPSFMFSIYYLVRLTTITYWNIGIRILAPLALSLLVISPFMIWKDKILGWPVVTLLASLFLSGIVYTAIIWWVGKKFHRGPYDTIQLIMTTLPKV